jgi:hypothetical protein
MPWFGLRRPYGILAFGNARDDSGDAIDRNHWNIYWRVELVGFGNVALRFGRIGSSSARSSQPSRRRTRGPPETALKFQPNLLRSTGLDVQTRLALERCRFLAAGPLGMESSGPRTTRPALERLSILRTWFASSVTHWNVYSGSAGLRPFYFGHVHYPAVSGAS